jgi:tRNA (mo5U34)-methyltransferase
MDRAEIQQRIDAIAWYHEFDFGDGLKAVSTTRDVVAHRMVWAGIRAALDRVDFAGKTVLDVGCWDGYWSFYAERRGAAEVLAVDDITQNWGGGEGLLLARELLRSSIAVDQHRSIYDLAALGRRFDIVLCLGVYYHLIDPFYGFAQLRHCCHDATLLLLEGGATLALRPDAYFFDFGNRSSSAFMPTPAGLKEMLEAAYFSVESREWTIAPRSPSLWRKLEILSQAATDLETLTPEPPAKTGRLFATCRPFAGQSGQHRHKPPFGLHRYDPRFAEMR